MHVLTADDMNTISRTRRGGPTPDENTAWENYLREAYLDNLPRAVHNKIYSQAWSQGHSSGYTEVEQCYGELAEMVDEIANALGYDRTGTIGNQP